MKFFKIINFILKHPLNKNNKISSILRFFKWQISQSILNYPILYNFTPSSILILEKGKTSATGNFYCGLLEFSEMGFLLHFLRKDDIFVDVGANVGSYSILASAEKQAITYAFEPIKSTYITLKRNISINNLDNIVMAFNIGIGSKEDKIYFTKNLDAMNHVTNSEDLNSTEVQVSTLDNILKNKQPLLLKIDVEGYESEVIDGALNIISGSFVKGIIIELKGHGNRYGYNEMSLKNKIFNLGYCAYGYNPFTRQLIEKPNIKSENIIFLKDIKFVIDRTHSAPKICINNIYF